jgi:hypothetical protein
MKIKFSPSVYMDLITIDFRNTIIWIWFYPVWCWSWEWKYAKSSFKRKYIIETPTMSIAFKAKPNTHA